MKRKIKYKNIILFIIIISCIISFIISIKNIINWKQDSNNTKNIINEINNIVDIETSDSLNVEIIKPNDVIDKSNPYWDYIESNLISVDFNDLIKINSDTKGWIQVNGTNINYPFVQAKNNNYYLTHSFDKTYNNSGWVFLDYRNNIDNLEKNLIIYAHGRMDTTMFGSLKNILKSGWLDNDDNYIVKLSTEKYNTLWQVFSVYKIPTTNDYIKVFFNSDDEFKNWTKTLLNRSQFDFNTSINKYDNVLTLSTCYNNKEKVVLHAKLIKKETR